MSRRPRHAIVLAAVLAALPAAPAAADSIASQFGIAGAVPTSISASSADGTVTGELTATFHGDAAAGCAALGVCGYSGTIVWRSQGASASLYLVRYRESGRVHHDAFGDIASGQSAGNVTTVVQRAVANGDPAGTCGDVGSGAATWGLRGVATRSRCASWRLAAPRSQRGAPARAMATWHRRCPWRGSRSRRCAAPARW